MVFSPIAESITFAGKLLRKMRNSPTNRNFWRELSRTRTKLQRHDQELACANTSLERSRKRARGGLHMHLRIDIVTRPSLRTGTFHGGGRSRPERGGRSI
ncbi:hypothetical protein CRG98_039611 [Punica granatum]|uniref:Uncharacterized protein n=1 Tax=Punica granatum TaxID=22663 RepID=A0A2I0I7I5_PUNGR|nr:hypothetical protein CRG98_039611 [Punica granatum]